MPVNPLGGQRQVDKAFLDYTAKFYQNKENGRRDLVVKELLQLNSNPVFNITKGTDRQFSSDDTQIVNKQQMKWRSEND